jgi:uncharacterized damage-inducible protein DinB
MTLGDLLLDSFARIRDSVAEAVQGLTPEELAYRVDPRANSIAWLVWHLTRIQDDHVAGVGGFEQIWASREWRDRFDLPFDPPATGYGHDSEQVAAVRPSSAELLIGYHDAVHEQTADYVKDLTLADLDRVVDTRWDPPVTLGVRVVSVLNDDLQHVGQAAFVRGIIKRR